MRLNTPGSEQGQMVVNEYGWCEGRLYRRVFDRCDGSTRWYEADEESSNARAEDGYDAGGAS